MWKYLSFHLDCGPLSPLFHIPVTRIQSKFHATYLNLTALFEPHPKVIPKLHKTYLAYIIKFLNPGAALTGDNEIVLAVIEKV